MMNNQTDTRFSSPLAGTRILVAEDVAEERAVLASYLHQQACRVFLASDGRDAIHKALVVQPDMLLMDLHMPVCDGLTACRMLKENPETRAIPIIFLTGAARPEERVEGLQAGAVDYITKPFAFEEIKLRLTIHLAGARNSTSAAPQALPGSTLDQLLFMSARQHLLHSIGTAVDLATLAAKVSCNPRRLNEAFKNCVGVTVLEYQREERMKEACQLLTETQMEIQEIASELGFTSGANFATAFKERYLMSPSDFRRSRTWPPR